MLGAVKASEESLDDIITAMGDKYQVEYALIKAVIQQESNWDVNASRYEAKLNDSSWGLMQVLLATGRSVLGNKNLTIAELIVPQTNIEAGTKFLGQLLQRYNYTYDDAIAAYNAGSARRGKDGKYINQAYVDGVNRWYNMYIAIKKVSDVASSIVSVFTPAPVKPATEAPRGDSSILDFSFVPQTFSVQQNESADVQVTPPPQRTGESSILDFAFVPQSFELPSDQQESDMTMPLVIGGIGVLALVVMMNSK